MTKTRPGWKSVLFFFVLLALFVSLQSMGVAQAHPENGTVPSPPPGPPAGPIIPPKTPWAELPLANYIVPGTVPGAGGDTSVTVGPDAVPAGTTLITTLFYPNGIPHGAFRTIYNHVVAVSFLGADGQPITTLNAPIQVCFQLGADDVAAAGGPDRIVIEWWDWLHGKWVALPTSPGTQPNQFCAPASQL